MPKYTASWYEIWEMAYVSDVFEADSVKQAEEMIKKNTHGVCVDVTGSDNLIMPHKISIVEWHDV